MLARLLAENVTRYVCGHHCSDDRYYYPSIASVEVLERAGIISVSGEVLDYH